jgi:uncharacterized protein YjiS (DUF1127 family)
MTLTIALLEAGRRLLRQPDVWLARSRIRVRLATLPQRQLCDLGLSPEAVAQEVQKPFWQPLGVMLGGSDRLEAKSRPAPRQAPRALRPAASFSAALLPWRS